MTVVVTGAAGHIGGNLVRALLAEGRKVRAVVREDTRAVDGLSGLEVVRADLFDLESLRAAFDGADVVYHLAARITIVGALGGLVERTNVEGPANVVQVCREKKVRRLVHFSSIHAFEQIPVDAVLDETRTLSDSDKWLAYDRSKARGQKRVLAAAADGLDAVVVNPTAVLGRLDFKPSRMGQVLLDLFHGRFPALVEGGFDWVDVRDVCRGAMTAEKQGRRGESYLLGGHYLTFRDLAGLVHAVTGRKVPGWVCPMWLARVGAPFSEAWGAITKREPLFTHESLRVLREANRRVSHEKAGRELGYAPRPLRETLEDAFAWFREAGRLES